MAIWLDELECNNFLQGESALQDAAAELRSVHIHAAAHQIAEARSAQQNITSDPSTE